MPEPRFDLLPNNGINQKKDFYHFIFYANINGLNTQHATRKYLPVIFSNT